MSKKRITAIAQITQINKDDVEDLAFGCALLGTGGGGSVGGAILEVKSAIRKFGPVSVVQLEDVAADGLVMPICGIGAPTISFEMLNNGGEAHLLRQEVERVFNKPVVAIMASEIGGSNGVEPVMWASRLGLPIVDADTMGRAFPEVQMGSFFVRGLPLTPIILVDFQGNSVTITPTSGESAESESRAFTIAAGGVALMADYINPAATMIGNVIVGSISNAIGMGRAVRGTQEPIARLTELLGAQALITGKISEIERHTHGGFVRGSVTINGTGTDSGRQVRIDIQNENLVAKENGRILASVPDLISVLDTQTGTAIATEEIKYAMRVTAMAWPCDPLWRTERALQTVGPRAFGYDIDYVPIEDSLR